MFEASLRGLKTLNRLGYGRAETGLVLNIVYNPQGSSLPPPQQALEDDYKRVLRERYGIGTMMCEGGSMLAGALLQEELVDELYLSLAPKLAAGTGPTVVTSPPLEPPAGAELVTAHEAGGRLPSVRS